MRFAKWLTTFLTEKDIELDEYLDTHRGEEYRALPVGFIVEHMKIAPPKHRAHFKRALVRLDFANADIRDYLAHLGGALWEEADKYIAVV